MKNKHLLILLTVMCISPMFADIEVMVPSVSPEHFKLLDQIVQIRFGLLSKLNESQIEQELKKLAERDTLAAIRYAILIERKKQVESNKIWETQFSALQQLAQKNNPQACLFLISAYRFGIVVEKNSEMASKWRKKYFTLQKAALLKDDPCSMLEELVITLQKQAVADTKIVELLRKLQKHGSVTAAEILKRLGKK